MEIVFDSSKELYDFLTKVKPITYSLDIGSTDVEPISGNIMLKIDSNKVILGVRVKGIPEDADGYTDRTESGWSNKGDILHDDLYDLLLKTGKFLKDKDRPYDWNCLSDGF